MDLYPGSYESRSMTLDDLSRELEASGDVLTLPAWRVRDAHGALRLGTLVRRQIESDLAKKGIGVYSGMPGGQDDLVRLYRMGSNVAALITAANTVGESYDLILRQHANGNGAEAIRRLKAFLDELELGE